MGIGTFLFGTRRPKPTRQQKKVINEKKEYAAWVTEVCQSIMVYGILETIQEHREEEVAKVVRKNRDCPKLGQAWDSKNSFGYEPEQIDNWKQAWFWLRFQDWKENSQTNAFNTKFIDYQDQVIEFYEGKVEQAKTGLKEAVKSRDAINGLPYSTLVKLHLKDWWSQVKLFFLAAFVMGIVCLVTITISGFILIDLKGQSGWTWNVLKWWEIAFEDQKSLIAIICILSILGAFFIWVWLAMIFGSGRPLFEEQAYQADNILSYYESKVEYEKLYKVELNNWFSQNNPANVIRDSVEYTKYLEEKLKSQEQAIQNLQQQNFSETE